MVQVIRKIVVPSGLAQQGGYSVPPYTSVHAHDTGNPNSSMQNEHDYLAGHYDDAFYTHLVGWNPSTGQAEAWQVAETNQGAWDLGTRSGNANGYASVEFVGGSISTQSQFNAAYQVYVELLRQLADEAHANKILDPQEAIATAGAGYIITHNFASRNGFGSSHVDPLAFLAKWGVSYDQFKKDIASGGSVNPGQSQAPQPDAQPANDVQYMKQFGYVVWNGKDFRVDDRGYINGMWQVISNELGGLQPTPTTSATEWTNNGVPMSEVDWMDGTDQSSTNGTRFKFKQDRMDIVDYDEPSNGIAVIIDGWKVWCDASVARNA